MQPALNFLSASKLAAMIRAGEITSRQTVGGFKSEVQPMDYAVVAAP